jgi:F-type H+-transporting ATPase subunit a
VSKKRVGCGCLGCSIPFLTFIILMVLLIPLSVVGFMYGGIGKNFTGLVAPSWMAVSQPQISVPSEAIFHIGSGTPVILGMGQVWPFPVTNTMIASFITILILFIISFTVTRKPKMIPSRMQSAMEAIIEWLYNFCKDVAGEKYGRKFFPLVATIFLYVMVNAILNLIPGYGSIMAHTEEGLVPLIRGANTDINTALALAIVAFCFIEFWGFKVNKFGYLKKFFNFKRFAQGHKELFTGKVKKGLGDAAFGTIDIIVGFLEFFLEFIRLVSFTFRLFGNMMGGEILMLVLFFLLIFAGFGAIPVIYGFEMLVGVVQALIFAGLTLVFATMAATSHEEEEHS